MMIMKLTKEEIQFIDNYLIKNGVKYWDVRIELLDHIVSAVEDKIINKGISFNEALIEAHKSFNNKVIHKDTFNRSLYQDNTGFKKFIRKKQKEIIAKQRKEYWRSFPSFLRSKRFFLEILIGLLVVFSIFQFSLKGGMITSYLLCFSPELVKFFYSIKKQKMTKHSLYMQLNFSSFGLSLLIFSGTILDWIKKYFKENEQAYQVYLIIIFSILFLFIRHGFNRYIKDLKTYTDRYNLLTS